MGSFEIGYCRKKGEDRQSKPRLCGRSLLSIRIGPTASPARQKSERDGESERASERERARNEERASEREFIGNQQARESVWCLLLLAVSADGRRVYVPPTTSVVLLCVSVCVCACACTCNGCVHCIVVLPEGRMFSEAGTGAYSATTALA